MPTFFIQAGRHIDKEAIRKQVENLGNKNFAEQGNKKALFVTEYVRSGESIQRLGKILRENGINFDIATVGMSEPETAYRKRGVFDPDTRLFLGSSNQSTEQSKPVIWSKPALTGLKPARKEGIKVSVLKLGPEIRQDTVRAREDVKVLSQRLINHLYPLSK